MLCFLTHFTEKTFCLLNKSFCYSVMIASHTTELAKWSDTVKKRNTFEDFNLVTVYRSSGG